MSKENIAGKENHSNIEVFKTLINYFDINSKDNQTSILEAVELAQNGYLPIIIANHQSHADGLVAAMISQKICMGAPDIKGMYLIISKSGISGHQGEDVKNYLQNFSGVLNEKKVYYLPIVRPKDVVKYGMNPMENVAAFKLIAKAEKDKIGFILFPEGSLDGGRIDPHTGKINGMTDSSANSMLDWSLKHFHKSFILPVAINGSYNIARFVENQISIDELKQTKSTVNIGEPIISTEIPSKNKTEYIMREIAKMLPEEARGIYKDNRRTNLD